MAPEAYNWQRVQRGRRRAMPHTIYVVRNAAGDVIYVGCTYDLASRMASHRYAPWWSEKATVETETRPDLYTALTRESELIREFDPPFNYIGTSRHRADASARWERRRNADAS